MNYINLIKKKTNLKNTIAAYEQAPSPNYDFYNSRLCKVIKDLKFLN